MTVKISIEEASSLWVLNINKSAFFSNELYQFIQEMKQTKTFNGVAVKGLRKDSNLENKFNSITDHLKKNKLIKYSSYKYFTVAKESENELEVLCSLYDQGYISYLSAMRFYNLTNRIPKNIDFVIPSRNTWKKNQAIKLSKKNINDLHYGSKIFTTPYPSKKLKIKKQKLNIHTRSSTFSPKKKGLNIRIIDIGDLFLEMIRYPSLCGGFQHVLEIYEEMAELLLDQIVNSTEIYGSKIDKCRVGYIIDTHLDISDDRINKWKQDSTSRGGSRKMISDSPYSEVYDEGWCLSLNHGIFNV